RSLRRRYSKQTIRGRNSPAFSTRRNMTLPFFIEAARIEMEREAKNGARLLKRYESKTEPSTDCDHIAEVLRELLSFCHVHGEDFSDILAWVQKDFDQRLQLINSTPDPTPLGPENDDSDIPF